MAVRAAELTDAIRTGETQARNCVEQRPLYPQKQTCVLQLRMSALGQ